jgi:hypothetical protein
MENIYKETLDLIVKERLTELRKTFAYQMASIAFMALCLLFWAHTGLHLLMFIPAILLIAVYAYAYTRAKDITVTDQLTAENVSLIYDLSCLNKSKEQEQA